MTVLLVDDEPIALRKLERDVSSVLPDTPMQSFTSAVKAMEYAEEHPINVAFLDIKMRVIDGITMAKHLQELYPDCNVIFCTGYTEYMADALDLYCSGYLTKPISVEKVRKAVENLRHPIKEEKRIRIRCFGNFEIYCDGTPMTFSYKRSKELLAYLVDRNGADCTTLELIAVLFEDEVNREYFKKLRADLLSSFENVGCSDVLRSSRGLLGINRELVDCDYFDYKDGKITQKPTEYMTQYSFSENTFSEIQ
ncbi:MAG: response regulator [Clostridia bacterium]|nr:response regulator [Clostridia bacterium]